MPFFLIVAAAFAIAAVLSQPADTSGESNDGGAS